jgi:GTPase SAR1 family protein
MPIVLIGNKSDEGSRVVSPSEVKDLADKYGWTFAEMSTTDRINVDNTFTELTRQALDYKGPAPKKHKSD